jgi:hypothetical protein
LYKQFYIDPLIFIWLYKGMLHNITASPPSHTMDYRAGRGLETHVYVRTLRVMPTGSSLGLIAS